MELNLDRHCGVITQPNLMPCFRSITCKSHSVQAKRAVMGRSLPFDILLERYSSKGSETERLPKEKLDIVSAATAKEKSNAAVTAPRKRKIASAELTSSTDILQSKPLPTTLEFSQTNITGPLLYPDQSINAILYKMKSSSTNNLFARERKSYTATPLHSTFFRIFSLGILPNCLNYRRTPGANVVPGPASLSNTGLQQALLSSQSSSVTAPAGKQKSNKKTLKPIRLDSSTLSASESAQNPATLLAKTSVLNSDNFSSMPDLTFI